MLKISILIVLILLILLVTFYHVYKTISTNMPYSRLLQTYPTIENDKPIYVFYHICTAGPKWESIVEEQINDIIQSGLYEKTTAIFYGCNCPKCDVILEEKFKGFSKITPLLDGGINPDTPTHENKTINAMITKARSGTADGYYLYIHSKGTTDKFPAQHVWRKFMMHWCVYNHVACINVLRRGFYTAGLLFRFNLPGPEETFYLARFDFYLHYAGNFFWATSEFVKKQPFITNLKNRYSAEIFILKHNKSNKHVAFTNEKLIIKRIEQGVYTVTGITNVSTYLNNQYNIYDVPVSIL